YEILAERIDIRDVDHVHGAILEPVPGEVAGRPVVRHETLAPGRDVQEPVADFPHRGDVMRPPRVAAAARRDFQAVEDRAEEPVQVGEGLYAVRGAESVVERSS